MDSKYVQGKIIENLCKEYQALWLISLTDLSMEEYYSSEDFFIQKAIDTVKDMSNYDEARFWYINNNVVESQKSELVKKTSIENILLNLSKEHRYIIEYRRSDNHKTLYNQLCYDKIQDKEGTISYITLGFRNIDTIKKNEIDELTGLYNRHTFLQKAEKELMEHPDIQYDIIISDISDFKQINEKYGTQVGDDILRWTGEYLISLHKNRLLLGRYGSDQFIIMGRHELVENFSYINTKQNYLDEKTRQKLPELIIKFGVYENVRRDRSIVSSCDKALLALDNIKNHYEKEVGYYDEYVREKRAKKHRIESTMHSSLKNGDFKVFYQPKHSAINGELVGAEALVRWIHPEYGFMNPGDFIPIFEQNGFIVENDKFVWKRTCENLKRWKDKGIQTVPISVNASKLTMADPDVVANMQIPMNENGLSPDRLHIEITETLMMDNTNDLIIKLNNIRTIGYEVELDDFGSGYSSINILSTLPLDVVKLDMSFMQQFGNEKRTKVLAACINLAKELGFRTVSEGVETLEQREVLGELGVDIIQGYYYSKPLSEEDFEQYLIEHQIKK